MSSVKALNMLFTTPPAFKPVIPTPLLPATKQIVSSSSSNNESYIYSSPNNTPKTIKQSLASLFKNIQIKKSCSSCGGGFK